MLSEKMLEPGQEAYEYAPEVAKLERVARAAKIVGKTPTYIKREHDNGYWYVLHDDMGDLRAALADLPEDALGG